MILWIESPIISVPPQYFWFYELKAKWFGWHPRKILNPIMKAKNVMFPNNLILLKGSVKQPQWVTSYLICFYVVVQPTTFIWLSPKINVHTSILQLNMYTVMSRDMSQYVFIEKSTLENAVPLEGWSTVKTWYYSKAIVMIIIYLLTKSLYDL